MNEPHPDTNSRQLFIQGMRDGMPICLGYLAVSFAFGIQAVSTGLSVFEATIISLSNVTSAGQFAGLKVIAESGSLIEMAGVQLIINLRYMLMSTAVSQKISPRETTLNRMCMAFGMTDEIFALNISVKDVLNPLYTYGIMLVSISGWTLGTFLGAYMGQILPDRLISALGVALYGMFIAIVIPDGKQDRNIALVIIAAMALSSLMYFAPVLKTLSAGMQIIIVTVAVSGIAAWAFPIKPEEEAS